MHCRLEGRKLNSQQEASRISLLTLHMQDKITDDLENPRYNRLSLIEGESIQPFKHSLFVFPSRKRPHHFLYVAIESDKMSGRRTYPVDLD